MKDYEYYFHLDEHDAECKRSQKRYNELENHSDFSWNPLDFCTNNVRYFLFQYRYRFIVISYNLCLQGFSHLSWKEALIKQIAGKKKTHIRRSVWLDEELKEAIKNQQILGKKRTEICYTYADNAGKEYCFTNSMGIGEMLAKDIPSLYEDSYLKCKEFLESMASKTMAASLIDDLKDLYYENRVYDIDTNVLYKSNELLIKHIREKTKL